MSFLRFLLVLSLLFCGANIHAKPKKVPGVKASSVFVSDLPEWPLQPASYQTNENDVLSLDAFIKAVLQRNSTLLIEKVEVAIAEQTVRGEYGVFEPRMNFGYSERDVRNPNNIGETLSRANLGVYEDRAQTFRSGLTGSTGLGGQWELSANVSGSNNSLVEQLREFDTEWESEVRVTLRQPLLQGFGRKEAFRNIRLARIDRDVAAKTFEATAMQLIDVAVEMFWRLAAAEQIRDSLSRQQILARKDHQTLEDEFLVGDIAEVDLLRSKKHLLDLEVEYQRALMDVEQGKQQMLSLLNVSGALGISTNFSLKHRDVANLDLGETTAQILDWAMLYSPSVEIAKSNVKRSREEHMRSMNQSRAQLDLVVSGWRSNLDDDRIESGAFSNDFKSWQAGLELTVPLFAGVQQRSAVSIARYRYHQAQLQRQSVINDIAFQINTGLDTLAKLQKQAKASHQSYLERKKMTEDMKRLFEFGEVQIRDVIDQQVQEFSDWRRYVSYLVETKIAQSRLDLATGTILHRYYPDFMASITSETPTQFHLKSELFE